jgi:hypothetical protein
MPKRTARRWIRLVLVYWIVGPVPLVAQPVPWPSEPNAGHHNSAANRDGGATAGDTPSAQAPSSAGPQRIVQPTADDDVAEKRNKHPNCDFGDIQECDLIAQQSMAISTARMNYAAWLGLGLTVLGLALIWRTMHHTKNAATYAKVAADASLAAVKEAERATAAANGSANITRLIGERQLRAYLVAISPTITYDDRSHEYRLTVQFKNTGQTPAYQVRVLSDVAVTNPHGADFALSRGQWSNYGVVGPHQTATEAAVIASQFFNAEYEMRYALNELGIFAFGRVEYVDAFNQRRVTKYRYRARTSAIGHVEEDMVMCNEGNEGN